MHCNLDCICPIRYLIVRRIYPELNLRKTLDGIRHDAIFEDLLSRHPEDTDLLRELWDGVLSYTADYVSTAYVEGVKYGIKNGEAIERFAADEDTEPEV